MRYLLVIASMLMASITPAAAQVSVQLALPGVSIGINQPVYPNLVPVPGYPVYYDPNSSSNYFFYDGMYWVFQGDSWYASSWFNGPWTQIAPQAVPLFVLRVPVRFYRRPPAYFHGWRGDAPPRWGERWGGEWEREHRGWDRWDRRAVPGRAPLPAYQRQYAGDRYPRAEQQHQLHDQRYGHRPGDAAVRDAYQAHSQHLGGPPARVEHQPAQPEHDRGRQGSAAAPDPRRERPSGEERGRDEHGREGHGREHDR